MRKMNQELTLLENLNDINYLSAAKTPIKNITSAAKHATEYAAEHIAEYETKYVASTNNTTSVARILLKISLARLGN